MQAVACVWQCVRLAAGGRRGPGTHVCGFNVCALLEQQPRCLRVALVRRAYEGRATAHLPSRKWRSGACERCKQWRDQAIPPATARWSSLHHSPTSHLAYGTCGAQFCIRRDWPPALTSLARAAASPPPIYHYSPHHTASCHCRSSPLLGVQPGLSA